MKRGPKHKLCRRVGSCIWGSPKCPSNKRPYAPGPHGNQRRRTKLSTYGILMMEKQKLRALYDLNEQELVFAYRKAKAGTGSTGEKLLRNLEMRLSSIVYRSGLAPTVFAAKQAISHRHILIDGKVVNRCSCRVKPGQVVSVNAQRSPAIANIAQKTDIVAQPYLELEKENCKVTVAREPLTEEIPANIEIMRVVEFYAR